MLFWNYHSNSNNAGVAAWNSGLHRYFDDLEGAQIIRDIAKVKKGTLDEELYFAQMYGKFGNIEEEIVDMVKSFYDPKVEEKGIEKGNEIGEAIFDFNSLEDINKLLD